MHDLYGHLAFGLVLISYLVRDILWLRYLSIVASAAAVAYNYLVPDPPLWLAIGWNVAFIAAHTGHLVYLHRQRRRLPLSDEEHELHEHLFPACSPREFAELMRIAEWRRARPGATLVPEGRWHDRLLVVFRGAVEVVARGRPVARLGERSLVGELGFVTEQPASAAVVAAAPTRYVAWSRRALERLLERQPRVREALSALVAGELANKLRHASASRPSSSD